jgi:protein-arginine kinase activator protein McsA
MARSHPAHDVLRDFEIGVDTTERINERESALLTTANNLEFEKAALCRDQLKELKRALGGLAPGEEAKSKPVSYRRSGRKRR